MPNHQPASTPASSTPPIALITGASSGIGFACANRLAAAGWGVFGTSRSPKNPAAQNHPSGGSIEMIAMNVDDCASVESGVQSVLAAAGRIDALINCAGAGLGGAIEDVSIDEAKALFETNFFGALRACRAALPSMRARGAGRIVNVSSIAGIVSLPFEGIYSATKFALEGMSESLRMEAKPFGVWVSLIQPGDFKTAFTDARKRAEGAGADSPYAKRFESVIAETARRERASPTPEPVAALLLKVLGSPKPRLRYRVGPGAYAAVLKPLLPGKIHEAAVERFFFGKDA